MCQYINILSLDVVAGSLVSSLFFSRIFQAGVSFYALCALALTVWIIYTIDHLRDARTFPATPSTARHRFHQKYFSVMAAFVILAMLVDFILIWFLPSRLLIAGIGLWCVVLVYLAFQRHLKFLKEIFVASLYTLGILLPSLATIGWDFQIAHLILIGKLYITALMNLLLFSLFDYAEDRKQKQHSFVTSFGPASARSGILILGLFNIGSGIVLWSFNPAATFIFVAMNSVLLGILLFPSRLRCNNYYRILGDGIFLIPAFYLLWIP
jgi:4-hydroxybenzoate polyprenyltransferase